MSKRISIALLLAFAALLATGCAGRANDPYVAGSYSTGQVQEIIMDVRDRRIEVLPSEDAQVHLDYFQNETERYAIELTDGILTVNYTPSKEWRDYIGTKPDAAMRVITLRLPDSLRALTISTTNADVCFGRVSIAGDLDAYANGGNLTFERLDVSGNLSLSTKNGNIDGVLAGCFEDYAITCNVKKGESSLPTKKETGEQVLVIDVNNGNADVQFEGR